MARFVLHSAPLFLADAPSCLPLALPMRFCTNTLSCLSYLLSITVYMFGTVLVTHYYALCYFVVALYNLVLIASTCLPA